MALGEQRHGALEAGDVRVASPADGAATQPPVSVTVDFELEAELFELVEQVARPQPAASPEIRIDQSDRVAVASGSRGRGVVLASILGASAASLGLAGVFVGGPGSPFDLASIGWPGAPRVVDRDASSPPPAPVQSAAASPPVAEPRPDRLQVSQPVIPDQPAPQPAHPQAHQRAPAQSSDNPDLFSSTQMTRWKPSLAAAPPAPSVASRPAAAPPHPTASAAAKPNVEPRITTPVPETRPTTIEGWTLREIVNGTAVLEGPGGSFRVARGDTVPGAGRVLAIFRWGNRSMVATSRGLISTP